MRIPNIVPSKLFLRLLGAINATRVAVVPAVHVTRCPPRAAEGAIQSPIWHGVGRGTDPIKYLG